MRANTQLVVLLLGFLSIASGLPGTGYANDKYVIYSVIGSNAQGKPIVGMQWGDDQAAAAAAGVQEKGVLWGGSRLKVYLDVGNGASIDNPQNRAVQSGETLTLECRQNHILDNAGYGDAGEYQWFVVRIGEPGDTNSVDEGTWYYEVDGDEDRYVASLNTGNPYLTWTPDAPGRYQIDCTVTNFQNDADPTYVSRFATFDVRAESTVSVNVDHATNTATCSTTNTVATSFNWRINGDTLSSAVSSTLNLASGGEIAQALHDGENEVICEDNNYVPDIINPGYYHVFPAVEVQSEDGTVFRCRAEPLAVDYERVWRISADGVSVCAGKQASCRLRKKGIISSSDNEVRIKGSTHGGNLLVSRVISTVGGEVVPLSDIDCGLRPKQPKYESIFVPSTDGTANVTYSSVPARSGHTTHVIQWSGSNAAPD